jgi:hypothetical protein
LLATDNCYDNVKTANGDTVQRRTTYTEIAAASQAPTESCDVHGEPRARLGREFSSSDLPRAALAVDLTAVGPIEIRSPTLLADNDPYNSLKPKLKPEPPPQPTPQIAETQKPETLTGGNEVKTANNVAGGSRSSTQTAETPPEIRKAIPVQPQEKKPVEIRRAIRVKPLDQEDEEETLLRSAVPPRDIDE